jgi:D-serine deaminase-like pyridoxal phosphate-dependent protein
MTALRCGRGPRKRICSIPRQPSGSTTDTFDTPAAVVDLDRLERNLARWQAHCDEVGLASRPHVKTHKCVEIARRQLELGAVGLTCQTLDEAEVMADAGFDDLLIPYNLVGASKLERLAALLARAGVAVSADDETLLSGLAAAADSAGRELGVLVDCDTGLGRTGVGSPGEAVRLAEAVARHSPLRLDGFVTYPAPPTATAFLGEAVAGAEARGLLVRVVSAGGTPAMWSAGELRPVVSEYRVGTYAFHDRNTVDAGAAALDDVALTIRATVVSRPAADRAVLDTGSKALSSDRSSSDSSFGLILEAPDSPIVQLNEEHGYVSLAPGDTLELGQQVRVVPNHVCVAVNLFDELVAVRGGAVVERWPVIARRSSRSVSA